MIILKNYHVKVVKKIFLTKWLMDIGGNKLLKYNFNSCL